jgi:hypothetical protein
MDVQYQFLKRVCAISKGKCSVPYSQLKSIWKKCPDKDTILNIANRVYVETSQSEGESSYFPIPEAFAYVRQCRDSIRNLIVTTTTLVVSVLALLTSILAIVYPLFQ